MVSDFDILYRDPAVRPLYRNRVVSLRYAHLANICIPYVLLGVVDADFEWDDVKAARNESLHGVTFREAREVFADASHVELFDEAHSHEEERFAAIGFSLQGRLLFVAFTVRQNRTRVISARVAEAEEVQLYEDNSH
jgi:uncharacterized DUF497 family protein